MERIGGFENIPMEPILGAPSRTRYRNKCQLPIGLSKNGEMQMGFYAVNSHRIIDTHTCLLQPEVFDRAAEAFRAWQKLSGESIYDEAAHSGVLRHLYMRCGEKSGEVLVCIVANGAKLHGEDLLVKMLREAVPEITGIVLNINRERTNVVLGRELRTLWGKPTIRDTLCRLEFEISPHAFYQVNRTQAEALYNKAAEYAGLTGAETLLDLYCGTGTIGLSMASRAKKLIGAEIIPSAVENARKNAAHNHVTNAEFLCGDAKDAARILYERGERPDVIVIDPPRKGCDAAVITTIAAMRPTRVVYVSCDPATLARDLKQFTAEGIPFRHGYALHEGTWLQSAAHCGQSGKETGSGHPDMPPYCPYPRRTLRKSYPGWRRLLSDAFPLSPATIGAWGALFGFPASAARPQPGAAVQTDRQSYS